MSSKPCTIDTFHRDPRTRADREYRAAWPGQRPMRAAFYQHLPEAPAGSGVTRLHAAAYVAQIQRVLDMEGWTLDERRRLYALRRKWQARADGRDARFNALGVQGGVTERNRRRTPGDRALRIAGLIDASIAGPAVQPTTEIPSRRYVDHPAYPFGKPSNG